MLRLRLRLRLRLFDLHHLHFRMLVLDNGRIVEFDSPAKLLADSKTVFYSMAKDAGLAH